jgi:hypothetical protein
MADNMAGLSAINPAGLTPENLAKYQEALQASMNALQARYENPNWFNVAAGFLKPQLGGFAASLGSAGAALGDWQEKQRANELPVAQMRAQLGQVGMLQEQKNQANAVAESIKGKPVTAEHVAAANVLDPGGPAAKSLQAKLDSQIKLDALARDNAEALRREQETRAKNPTIITNIGDILSAGVQGDDKARQASIAKIHSAKPPNIDQATWDATPDFNKIDQIARYNASTSEQGATAEQGDQKIAESANKRIPLLRNMRELALQPGMKLMFDYFGTNNLIDVLGQAATNGKFGETLKDVDTYMKQLGASPEVRSRGQILAKLIAQNQAEMRSATTHPTDASQTLLQIASPNLNNSQTAFVSLVDLIGNSEKHAVDMYHLRMKGGPGGTTIPARELQTSPEYYSAQQRYSDERSRIALEDPTVRLPSWYSSAPAFAKATPVAAAAAVAPAAAPSDSAKLPAYGHYAAAQAEIAKRKAAKEKGTQ